MQAVSVQSPPLKVVLVSSFEDSFLHRDILPELARRGVEVVSYFESRRCSDYDFDLFKSQGVTLILHMVEIGPHNSSERLSRIARAAGIPIKALSRKKAFWDFLPPPPDSTPPSSDPVVEAAMDSDLGGFATGGLFAAMHARDADLEELSAFRDAVESGQIQIIPFDRRTARLRDVVRLCLGHGVTDLPSIVHAVLEGRDKGVFPRLIRVKSTDIPKLVASMLEQENEKTGTTQLRLHERDRKSFESIGFNEDNAIQTSSEPVGPDSFGGEDYPSSEGVPMGAEKVTPISPPLGYGELSELSELRRRLAELEKLSEAHAALKNLVRLGYMSAAEAAEKLFGGPL